MAVVKINLPRKKKVAVKPMTVVLHLSKTRRKKLVAVPIIRKRPAVDAARPRLRRKKSVAVVARQIAARRHVLVKESKALLLLKT